MNDIKIKQFNCLCDFHDKSVCIGPGMSMDTKDFEMDAISNSTICFSDATVMEIVAGFCLNLIFILY